MGLNLAYDKHGVTVLDGKPIQDGRYRVEYNGEMVAVDIHVVRSKRFTVRSSKAFALMPDGKTLDVVKSQLKIDVVGALHRIPGQGAWHGSGGMTTC